MVYLDDVLFVLSVPYRSEVENLFSFGFTGDGLDVWCTVYILGQSNLISKSHYGR